MAREHLYQAKMVWSGGAMGPTASYRAYSREWQAELAGKPAIIGSADPTFLGDKALYNPEELLLVALASCHMLSYLALCARDGLSVHSYDDEAEGRMGQKDGRIRFLEVVLHPKVVLDPAADLDRAAALHHDAHEACFIASSVNFPVRAEPSVRHAGRG